MSVPLAGALVRCREMAGMCRVTFNLQKQTQQLQWSPSIAPTLGEQHFGHYIRVAFIEGLFCTQSVHLGPGSWPLYRGGLYSGVAVKRGSTVSVIGLVNWIFTVLEWSTLTSPVPPGLVPTHPPLWPTVSQWLVPHPVWCVWVWGVGVVWATDSLVASSWSAPPQ